MKDSVARNLAMTVHEAIASRRSIRSFLPKKVEPEVLSDLLRLAGRAPSGSNIQPWQVHVVQGAARDRLSAALLSEHKSGRPGKPEYNYYPVSWRSPYIERRRQTGWGLYQLLGIQKGDKEAMSLQHGRNFLFFDAPVALIFTIDKDLQHGSWLDYGMFLQNIMIGARGFGLHTCPQAALAYYPEIVKSQLGIGDDRIVVCGMSLGYADPDQLVNEFQPERIPLEAFVKFYSE